MLPKIEACIDFVKSSDRRRAIIGSLENARDAVKRKNGTLIKKN